MYFIMRIQFELNLLKYIKLDYYSFTLTGIYDKYCIIVLLTRNLVLQHKSYPPPPPTPPKCSKAT